VKTTSKVGVCVLTLVVFALPSLACLMPGLAMSAAEHACCKHMAQECGSNSMGAQHPCCQRVATSDRFGAAQVKSKYLLDHHVTVLPLHFFAANNVLGMSPDFVSPSLIVSHGPPGLHPSSSVALRI
jgi:hypothetical protein